VVGRPVGGLSPGQGSGRTRACDGGLRDR
jgi:hypothetical protein